MISFTSNLLLAPVSKRYLKGLVHETSFQHFNIQSVYLSDHHFPDIKILQTKLFSGTATHCLRGDCFLLPTGSSQGLSRPEQPGNRELDMWALKFNFAQTVHAAQGKVHKDRSRQPSLLVPWWLWVIEAF